MRTARSRDEYLQTRLSPSTSASSAIRKVAWIKVGSPLRTLQLLDLADQSFAEPLSLVATLAAFSRLIVAWEPHCDNIARRSRAATVIGKELRAGGRLDMTRFVLLS